MTTKRGDVALVRFPRSDLRGWDRRPALVVHADGVATVVEKAIHSVIGALPDMNDVDAALRHTLAL